MLLDARRVVAVVALLASCVAERWRWPDAASAPSVRIDTKVRFVDDDARDKAVQNEKQADEVPFKEPTDTSGFYNRPPGAGRYPVRVQSSRANYRVNPQSMYPIHTATETRPSHSSDGTLDSLQYCKCVSTPDCNPQPDYAHACGAGQYLCCFKRPNTDPVRNPEFFNEVDDERPMLLPGQENPHGAFPPPMSNELYPFGHLDAGLDVSHDTQPDVLVGPDGPSGQIGPQRPVLVGPDGPTGQVGPPQRPVLVGPDGPTGQVGPPERPVLVGPDGPTGVIGPDNSRPNEPYRDIGHSGSAQRGVLIGPSGPTGIIGPYNRRPMQFGGQRGVLSGPGGPTGIIGPAGYGRQYRPGPGILVGPGGPTGTIGPGRQLLVGPGGPTGHIGPRRYFACQHQASKDAVETTTVASKLKTCTRAAPVRACVKRSDGTRDHHSHENRAETEQNYTTNIRRSDKPASDEVKEIIGSGIKRVLGAIKGNARMITERVVKKQKENFITTGDSARVSISHSYYEMSDNTIAVSNSAPTTEVTKSVRRIRRQVRRRKGGRRVGGRRTASSTVIPTTTTTTEEPMKELKSIPWFLFMLKAMEFFVRLTI